MIRGEQPEPLDVGIGLVWWSTEPTERDQVGCDGLYVSRIKIKPIYHWPMTDVLRVAVIAVVEFVRAVRRKIGL